MAITTTKKWNSNAKDYVYFYNNNGQPTAHIEGLVQVANSDGEVIDPATGAAAATGGGSSTYSTVQGDFTATATVGANTFTITGYPYTVTAENLVNGSVKKIASDGTVTTLDTDNITVASGVVTLGDESNFVSGDSLVVSLTGPDKAYDPALDATITFVTNPDYAHYTSVETLISQTDLGITATADGTNATTLTDADGAFDPENVAVGFEAYSEGEDTAATVITVDSATQITTDAITDWSSDVYWLPECERYIIPFESYKDLVLHIRMATDNADNVAYMKLYATLDADADDTDDTYWVDKTAAYLSGMTGYGAGTAESGPVISATNTTVEDNIVISGKPYLKWMIKIVGEVIGGGGAAAAAQDFDIYIKKVS